MTSPSSRSLRSVLLGLPVLALVTLGLAVSVQVGCAPVDEDDGIGEDQGAFRYGGYRYRGNRYGGYGYGGYGP